MYSELVLVDTISDPVETHVNDLEAA
jgi:hypothetical protein